MSTAARDDADLAAALAEVWSLMPEGLTLTFQQDDHDDDITATASERVGSHGPCAHAYGQTPADSLRDLAITLRNHPL